MAAARYDHAMTVLDCKLYAVGGHNNGFLSSVEQYDPALDAWEAVAPMAVPRRLIGMAVLDGKLYAVGGHNNNDSSLSSVERYDPALDEWEAVAPMASARMKAFAVLM